MSTLDTIAWGIAGLAVLISLMNPGGLIIGGGIALLVLGARYGVPFLGDLIRVRQRGVRAEKIQRKARDQMREAKQYDPRDDDGRRRR